MKNFWLNKSENKVSKYAATEAWAEPFLEDLSIDGEKLLAKYLLNKYKNDAQIIPEHLKCGCNDCEEAKDYTIVSGKVVQKSKYGKICSKCGEEMWPFNDEYTLMQGDPMCACYRDKDDMLSMWYDRQFVQNEDLAQYLRCEGGVTFVTTFAIGHTPVLDGTFAATIRVGEENIQTVCEKTVGNFDIQPVSPWNNDNLAFKVVGANLYGATGTLALTWDREPMTATTGERLPIQVIASYEYKLNNCVADNLDI
jgi:hypothetical protein